MERDLLQEVRQPGTSRRDHAMWFVTQLYQHGIVSAQDVLEAAARQIEGRIPLGQLALELEKMSLKQVASVLAAQADENEPFGRLAVKFGFLSESDLAYLLMAQADRLKPLPEILIEMGAIDRETLEAEYRKAHGRAAGGREDVPVVENAL